MLNLKAQLINNKTHKETQSKEIAQSVVSRHFKDLSVKQLATFNFIVMSIDVFQFIVIRELYVATDKIRSFYICSEKIDSIHFVA